jgi:uncharacterized protein YbjT (DUF2867 family)
MSRTILVTGATGKQGGSVIENLANNPEFTLLAVTRNTAGGSAQKLTSKGSNIKLVQGDMDDVQRADLAGQGRHARGRDQAGQGDGRRRGQGRRQALCLQQRGKGRRRAQLGEPHAHSSFRVQA